MSFLKWLFDTDPERTPGDGYDENGVYHAEHDTRNQTDRYGKEIPDSSPCDKYWERQGKIDL